MNPNLKKNLRLAKYISLILLSGLKSLFLAVTQVAWGIASIFLLNLLIVYFLQDGIPAFVNLTFLKLEQFCLTNVLNFFWVFFVLIYFYEIKEILNR